MNKLLSKIVGAALGLIMAIGVGVAVSANNGEAVPVHAASSVSGTYTKVTTANGISAGDTVIMVNTAGTKALTDISTTSTKYGTLYTFADGEVSDDKSTITLQNKDVEELTVETGYNSSGFSFKGTADISSNYLTWTSGNSLNKASTKSANTSWTITASNGTLTIANNSTSTRLIRFNSDRFACYTSNTGTLAQLYKKAANVSVTGVSVTPTSVTLGVGATQQLTPTITPNNATDKAVTYSTSASGVATVSSTGLITAASAGSATITVTTHDGSFTATCSVTVTAPIAVTGVSLNKPSTTIEAGQTETLTATVTPANASNKSVTWTTSDSDVATVAGGVVTAKAAGTATITATTVDGGFTATCSVKVSAPANVVFTAGTDTGSSGGQYASTITKSGISIAFSSCRNNDAPYRIYANSTTTISSTIGDIAKIEFNMNGSYSSAEFSVTDGGGTYNSSDTTHGVWTGTSTSVEFTAANQTRCNSIVVTLASTDPSVELDPSSATSVNMLDGDTNSTVKVLAKNIDDYTAWALTFDEDGDEGLTSSDYVTVVPGAFSNNVSTFAITAKKVGSTVLNIQLDGTDCEDTVEITISQKPASITITHADVYEKDNKLQLDLKAGGTYKQMTFSGEDIRGNTYTVAAADVTPSIQSGSSYVTVSGSRITPTSTAGTAVVRYTLNALTSVYVDLTVNVISDRNVSVNSITYVASASGVQGEPLKVSDIISATSTTTLFGETGTIADGEYLFAYSNNRSIAVELDNFVYEITDDTLDAGETENREIFVFVSFDESYASSTHVDIEVADRPLTAISLDTGASLSLNRNTSHQLEVSYTPYNTTSTRAVTYAITSSSSESSITVSNSGLISAGSKIGSTATIKVTSQFSVDIYASVNVTVTREAMTITYDIPEEWVETDASDLAVGDQVILTGVKDSVTYAAGTYSGSGNNVPADTTNTLTVSGTKVTGVVSTMIYTLEEGTVDGSVAFKDSSGKYLYAASSGSNYMKSQDEIDGNASFILNSDGTVVAQGTNTRNYMRYNNSGTSNLFSCYASTGTTGTLVQFYKLTGGSDTITVGDDLFNDLMDYYYSGDFFECDPDGATFDGDGWKDVGEVLADYKDTYKLNYARANASGNEVEQFLAIYDYVVAKYGDSYDYLGRIASGKVTESSRIAILGNVINNSSTISIIVVVSLVSLTAIGGYFFLRTRKED